MDKILIVEDSMELSDVLCRNLQEEGFAVSIASSLAQARKSLDSGIDLCLLDLNLPDGAGFTFCRYLGENTAIPVILLMSVMSHRIWCRDCLSEQMTM